MKPATDSRLLNKYRTPQPWLPEGAHCIFDHLKESSQRHRTCWHMEKESTHMRDALAERIGKVHVLPLCHVMQHLLNLCIAGRGHAHTQAPAAQRVNHLQPA